MEYIYDILLNFQKDYCDFFEWQPSDKIINIKKIKLYKINNKDYLSLKYNNIILDTNIFDNQVLVTNGIEVMGLLFKNNKLLKRSSLLIDESSDILNHLSNQKITNLKYLQNIPQKINYLGRNYQEKNQYLNNFFSKINFNKDEYLLKYIYYDLTNIIEDNPNTIYNKLLEIKKHDYNHLYQIINKIKKGI